ncbi:ammosamide/lymphostin RiPP family protein [Actinomadura macra]|uniref:ammosamide/lymphostin RiPP family protein n=1 Tax=Actinomadura macra TaxID=46164 RepID=UPI0008297E6D
MRTENSDDITRPEPAAPAVDPAVDGLGADAEAADQDDLDDLDDLDFDLDEVENKIAPLALA